MRHVRSLGVIAVVLLTSSCVPVDQLPPGAVPNAPTSGTSAAAFPDPESGGVSITSAHFTIKGYNQIDLESVKLMAESLYTKIGNDAGLYSFLASTNFTLVQYRDRDEYMAKTHQPNWSHAVASGKGIYFYPQSNLEPVLAHQMVHLIYESYMGEKASSFRWIEEGLAMNEEVSKLPDSDRTTYLNTKSTQLRQNRVAFSQMTFFVTNTEEKRLTDAWYEQVESVVSYLLAQGSPLAFAQLLSDLRSTGDIDRALSDAYAAKYRSLNDLEAAWKYTI